MSTVLEGIVVIHELEMKCKNDEIDSKLFGMCTFEIMAKADFVIVYSENSIRFIKYRYPMGYLSGNLWKIIGNAISFNEKIRGIGK